MIQPSELTEADVGRVVEWRGRKIRVSGTLTSWNDKYVFVRFLGPNSEACYPQDVFFLNTSDEGE